MTQIKYSHAALQFFDNLVKALIKNGYFSIEENAIEYKRDVKTFIEFNIEKQQHKVAPSEFDKFGKNLKYISYKRSKRTTWYIFFVGMNNSFVIKHITNNHLSAQYFGK